MDRWPTETQRAAAFGAEGGIPVGSATERSIEVDDRVRQAVRHVDARQQLRENSVDDGFVHAEVESCRQRRWHAKVDPGARGRGTEGPGKLDHLPERLREGAVELPAGRLIMDVRIVRAQRDDQDVPLGSDQRLVLRPLPERREGARGRAIGDIPDHVAPTGTQIRDLVPVPQQDLELARVRGVLIDREAIVRGEVGSSSDAVADTADRELRREVLRTLPAAQCRSGIKPRCTLSLLALPPARLAPCRRSAVTGLVAVWVAGLAQLRVDW